jgi:hypothetical protein
MPIQNIHQLMAAIRKVIDFNWAVELDDYHNNCGDGPEDNQRAGHIFETLVDLDNYLTGTNCAPVSYILPEAVATTPPAEHPPVLRALLAGMLKRELPWLGTADSTAIPYPSGADAIDQMEQLYRQLGSAPAVVELQMEADAQAGARREQDEVMSQEELDELVTDAKCGEAATLNNEGREAQIAYLPG